jgi:AraC-type DNA-binding domain-containing proteins
MNYRIDLFALFIFLGMVQGIFLLFFFLSSENRKRQVNRFHALLLISIIACILEIFLGYTGYIINALHLVDFSEVFGLLIGPSFYLLVVSLIRGPIEKKYYFHLLFPVVYLLMQIPFLILPEDAKYNAYVGAFRPDLPYRNFDMPYEENVFYFTEHHTELVLLSLLLYSILGLLEVIKIFREKQESFWKPQHPVLVTLRMGTIQIVTAFIIILVVKLFNEEDLGDHILAAYIAITIYFTSFSVIRQSGFFKQASLSEVSKYKSSSLTSGDQQELVIKLTERMKIEKPFLQPGFSLPDLARQLNVSVHTLSQVINDGLGKSFFEMTAEYRIEEAKSLLKSQPNIKVEEIAEQVGYNSKSSFNTAFKKLTGKTPGEFRSGI